MTGSEHRRAPRFKASLRVEIAGVDATAVTRKGDVSAGGLFLELDRDIGPLGSMQRLVLADTYGASAVTVLARVVRIATVDDFWRGTSIAGVAFQFLFEEVSTAAGSISHPAAEAPGLARLLRTLVANAAGSSGVAIQGWRGTVDAGQGRQATALQDLTVQGMVLEVDHPIAPGLAIRVELSGASPDQPLSFEGEVVDCVEDAESSGTRFRARVAFRGAEPIDDDAPPASGSGDTMSAAFSSLLDAVSSNAAAPPARPTRAAQLSGDLSRVSLVSILTLCQLEQVTGVLSLDDGRGQIVRAYLREGEVLDAEATTPGRDARQALSAALRFATGTFSVKFGDVERPSRIAEGTAALVRDLAREHEAR